MLSKVELNENLEAICMFEGDDGLFLHVWKMQRFQLLGEKNTTFCKLIYTGSFTHLLRAC